MPAIASFLIHPPSTSFSRQNESPCPPRHEMKANARSYKPTLTGEQKQEDSQKLFNFSAECLKTEKLPLGFTVHIPAYDRDADKTRADRPRQANPVDKDFGTPQIEGHDVAAMFRKSRAKFVLQQWCIVRKGYAPPAGCVLGSIVEILKAKLPWAHCCARASHSTCQSRTARERRRKCEYAQAAAAWAHGVRQQRREQQWLEPEEQEHRTEDKTRGEGDKLDDNVTWHGLERQLSTHSMRKPLPPGSAHVSLWMGLLVQLQEDITYIYTPDHSD
ncbi:hypothetical protein DFH09DRAFT_1330408 [Mycena vulgaris]|nr:hypothetical protein DFH09DRAFT_1330408 [Mycena vulgaris]